MPIADLLQAIEQSDVGGVSQLFWQKIELGKSPAGIMSCKIQRWRNASALSLTFTEPPFNRYDEVLNIGQN